MTGSPRLVLPGLATLALAFALATAALSVMMRAKTDEARAAALLRAGRAAEAELVWARLARERPTVPIAMALLSTHETAVLARRASGAMRRDFLTPAAKEPLAEEEIDRLVDGLPPDVALIARFARPTGRRDADEATRREVTAAAEREPPLPWANHALAREARRARDPLGAAQLFLREGLAFPERAADVDEAVRTWMDEGAWEKLDAELADPRVSGAVSAPTRFRIATQRRDAGEAVRALPGMWRPRFSAENLALAGAAALAWAFFLARLGQAGRRPAFRVAVYTAAFALGVMSVAPTLLLLAVEEAKLHLTETGEAGRDVLFFVFGVGLREEACKLLLFAPLLPVLRRFGDKLDVLVAGAMVGLGFAAEENLGYLASENLHTGVARFLTANFLHVAMTGVLASALDDFSRDRERFASDFMRSSLLVVGLHGAYDFLLSHSEYGGPFLAMVVFVVLTRLFFDAVDAARRRADRGLTPAAAFVVALAAVTGVSLAHAVAIAGPRAGAMTMTEGLLGEAIIAFVFVRTLGTLR